LRKSRRNVSRALLKSIWAMKQLFYSFYVLIFLFYFGTVAHFLRHLEAKRKWQIHHSI
jgi:hypothetical protein